MASQGEKLYPDAALLSPRIQMEDVPLCTLPEVHAYIDGSILHCCVCLFYLVQILQACHCSRVFWSAIISGVWFLFVTMRYQTEAGFSTINPFLVSGRILHSRFRGLPSSPCREHEDSINAQWENALRLQSQPPRLNIFNL